MIILSLITFSLAVVCYGVKELAAHDKLKWMTKGFSFWGEDSYLRKYKNIHPDKSKFQVAIPKDNWYYSFFVIKYRERFPLSATLLVFLTDGYHLMQLGFKLLLVLAIVMYRPMLGWWDALIFFVVWGITFTISYKMLSR